MNIKELYDLISQWTETGLDLECPDCGHRLHLNPTDERISCGECGNEIPASKPIKNTLNQILQPEKKTIIKQKYIGTKCFECGTAMYLITDRPNYRQEECPQCGSSVSHTEAGSFNSPQSGTKFV